MKYRLLFAFAASLFLCACASSVPYTLAGTPKDPKPLDPSVPVVVVNASSVPVLPFEYTYLGTIETEASVGCSTGGTVEQLRKMGRELGANVVYVKKVDTGIAFVYTGVVMMSSPYLACRFHLCRSSLDYQVARRRCEESGGIQRREGVRRYDYT